MSTDTMVRAPTLPEKLKKSAKFECANHHEDGILKERNHGKENWLGLSSDSHYVRHDSLKQRHITSTSQNGRNNNSEIDTSFSYDSLQALINSGASQNYKPQQSTLHKVTFDRSMPSATNISSHTESNPTSHHINVSANYKSPASHDCNITDRPSSLTRPPPSWIDEFEVSNRPPPSWIDDLETSGRPVPSWIQDVTTSGVDANNLSNYQTSSVPTSRFKYTERTLQTNQPGNLRNLSTASELLTSSSQIPHSRTHNELSDLRITDLDDLSTSSPEEMLETSKKLCNKMYREQDQRISKHSAAQRTSNHPSVGMRAYKQTSNYKFEGSATPISEIRNANNQKDITRNESFTTDDLLRISPTGRDFPVELKTSPKTGSIDHKSHRYSMNRSPKVSRRNSSVRDKMARSQDRAKRMAAHTKDSHVSMNTESLIYSPTRGEGLTTRQLRNNKRARNYGKLGSLNQNDSRMSSSASKGKREIIDKHNLLVLR